MKISIHVPREGDDRSCGAGKSARTNFNPRPPRGGRPFSLSLYLILVRFQSTSPARGTTILISNGEIIKSNFNPRPPRGGRLVTLDTAIHLHIFQSTSPARGTTKLRAWQERQNEFQSTSPARGTTASGEVTPKWDLNFNPRPPRGGRRYYDSHQDIYDYISIHVPREGDDRFLTSLGACDWNFNPRPPRGGRQRRMVKM